MTISIIKTASSVVKRWAFASRKSHSVFFAFGVVLRRRIVSVRRRRVGGLLLKCSFSEDEESDEGEPRRRRKSSFTAVAWFTNTNRWTGVGVRGHRGLMKG
mgnify:CR=1 FL=1